MAAGRAAGPGVSWVPDTVMKYSLEDLKLKTAGRVKPFKISGRKVTNRDALNTKHKVLYIT